jgi:hypothetical protein
MFAKLKAQRWKIAARSVEALLIDLGQLVSTFEPANAATTRVTQAM